MLPLCRESASELAMSFKVFQPHNAVPHIFPRLHLNIFLDGQDDNEEDTETFVSLRSILRAGGDTDAWRDGAECIKYGSRCWSGKYYDVPTTLYVKGGPTMGGKRYSQLMFIQVVQDALQAPVTITQGADAAVPSTQRDVDDGVLLWFMDGDAFVDSDSLSALIHTVQDDPDCVGATANLWPSNFQWLNPVLPIQYFEYLCGNACKEAESSLGAVTVLCGCSKVVRYSAVQACIPSYSPTPHSDDLVTCNLLNLGEDRYLTTLLLSLGKKCSLSRDTSALTACPDTFVAYVTQRRRWVNSTLVNDMILMLRPPPGTSWVTLALVISRFMSTCFRLGVVFALICHMPVGGLFTPGEMAYLCGIYMFLFLKSVSNMHATSCRSWLLAWGFFWSAIIVYAIGCAGSELWKESGTLLLFWQTFFVFFSIYAFPTYGRAVWSFLVYFFTMGFTFIVVPLYAYANMDDLSWGTRGIKDHEVEGAGEMEGAMTSYPFMKGNGSPQNRRFSATSLKWIFVMMMLSSNLGLLGVLNVGQGRSWGKTIPASLLFVSLFHTWYSIVVAMVICGVTTARATASRLVNYTRKLTAGKKTA